MIATKMSVVRVLIVMVTVLGALNCAKKNSSNKSTSNTTAAGYITCPQNGSYVRNGMTYQCTPGTSVLAGNATVNGGYTTCPPQGYYTQNGMTYSCQPGSTYYSGGNNGYNTGYNNNDICAQYGYPGYILTQLSNGQQACVAPGYNGY
jgi:hypothetical protein